ncbi:hypothetical protein GW17_00055837 [Ensete ventricosum]|nr:hypothetical protein GW17_00055837 [Ensete ventricosum]
MSMSLVWQPSRSTSLALAVAIASIGDTICLIVAYHRLTIPLCIVSTPPKKGPQHCGPEPSPATTAALSFGHHLPSRSRITPSSPHGRSPPSQQCRCPLILPSSFPIAALCLPYTVAASPTTQLLPSPSTATLLAVDLPCSRPTLSNRSERPTLYSFSTMLLAAAFLLLNRSRSHSRRPYLYCRCILFFSSSTLLHPHVFTDLLCRELLFHFSNRLPDLLEGAISCILPRHRSAIALRPGQIARLHRVRPCVKAARARRTATCPAASPPSAVPGGKRLLWLPFLLFVVIASLTDALQSAVDFFYGRSSTSSTVLSPLSRVTLPPFHRFAIWDVRFLVLWIDSMLPPATTSLTDKDASRGPWTEKPIVRGHGRHEARVKKMRRNRRIRRRRRGRKRNLEGPGGGGRGVGDGAERSGDRESHGRRPPSGTT